MNEELKRTPTTFPIATACFSVDKELNIKDFINELFFELIRHKNSMFLPDDAIMGCIEINENVIHEV